MIDYDKFFENMEENEPVCKIPQEIEELNVVKTEIGGTSNCCNAPVTVISSDEGTQYYSCSKCGNPCDLLDLFKKGMGVIIHKPEVPDPFDVSLVKTEFGVEKVKELVDKATGYIVETDAGAKSAVAIALSARKLTSDIGKIRKSITAPYTAFHKGAISLEKEYTNQLEEIECRLLGIVDEYMDKRMKTFEENGVVDDSLKFMSSEIGSASEISFYEIEVEDIKKVPAKYLKINHALIQADIKAGLRTIDGLSIHEVKKRKYRVRGKK